MPIIFADGECIKKVGMRSNIMRKILCEIILVDPNFRSYNIARRLDDYLC